MVKITAVLQKCILFAMLFVWIPLAAQIPSETVLDSVEMKKMREQKVMYKYNITVKFDSVTGKLPKNPKPDTTFTLYDRLGRVTDFSYMNSERERRHGYIFYDRQGRVVRKFSCNADSTEGFVDYWTYNERGLVASENSYTREGRDEVLFKTVEFFYNEAGQLIEQLDYNSAVKVGSLHEKVKFSYNGDWVISTGFRPNGDTSFIDSSLVGKEKFNIYSARYAYFKSWNGKYSRIRVSRFEVKKEDLGSRERTIMSAQFFSYTDGSLNLAYTDTSLSDRKHNLIEVRSDKAYTKYFWNNDGTFDYSVRYNRRNEPLEKRTTAYRYYE